MSVPSPARGDDGIPTFSVVTPSYNQARFVGETIESVLSQEGRFRLEYFVMDGGSSDGSAEIIRDYALRVERGEWGGRCAGLRMHWVSRKDRGQSDAINQGMRLAGGDYLSYINSDDCYCPGAFARVAGAFQAFPRADFVYGDGEVVHEDGSLQWDWLSRPYSLSVMRSYHFLLHGFTRHITPTTAGFTNYIMQQSTFWRRSVLDRIGPLDEQFHFAMDAEYWVRAGHAGLQLRHIPHKLARFRFIGGTKSKSSPTVFWEDYLEIFRRYRGARRLSLIFAYHYFNLAQLSGLDYESALASAAPMRTHWGGLPPEESAIIEAQRARGRRLGGLLVASALRREGRTAEAEALVQRSLHESGWLALHPLGVWCSLLGLAGRHARILADAVERAILVYHAYRYDYRYLRATRLRRSAGG